MILDKYTGLNKVNSDLKAELSFLWRELFPSDSEGFVNFYLSESLLSCDAVVYTVSEENRIVSMLFSLPREFIYKGETKKAMLLAGIGTRTEYRKQGIASMLIKRAIDDAKKEGIEAVILHPETEKLIDFYALLGFVSLNSMWCSVFTVAKPKVECDFIQPRPGKLLEIYNKEMKGKDIFFRRSECYFEDKLAEQKVCNDWVFTTDEAYAFALSSDDTVIIYECAGNISDAFLNSALSVTQVKQMGVYSANKLELLGISSCEKQCFNMVFWINSIRSDNVGCFERY